MHVDARLRSGLEHAAADAMAAEEIGFSGAWNSEGKADPFLPIALGVAHTQRLALGSAVAIAFARTPMTVAYQSADLQRFSEGRFVLGLGSQIRPHIERRFGMPWSKPAARMKDFVLALRAIWHAWDTGESLEYQGEFYSHTLMTPKFSPPPNPYSSPMVFLAAVGPLMLRTAAQVADGLFVHPFLTERYLREVILPEVHAHRGEGMPPLQIAISPFVALDESDVDAVRRQISFYGSTPAYRPVLEMHGWGELQEDLYTLSKQGRWDEMVPLVTDEILHTMCSVGTEQEIAADLQTRFSGAAHRIRFNRPGDDTPSPSRFAGMVEAMRAAT